MRHHIGTLTTTTFLALPSLWAFVLAQLEYTAFEVAVPPQHTEDLALQCRALNPSVLELLCWVSWAFLSLAVCYSGPGCPHLPHCTVSRLLPIYTQGTCSRSLFAILSARFSSHPTTPAMKAVSSERSWCEYPCTYPFSPNHPLAPCQSTGTPIPPT